jgi:rhamnulokinase
MGSLRMLAVDLGAESGRALMGRFDGSRLAIEDVHRFPNVPVHLGAHLYWDFPRLFDDVLAALRKAGPGGLDSLGVDAWGVDFGLVDARGELLGNPVHYRDRRTEGMMEAAFQRVPRDEIYRRTGIQFLPINTVYQLLAMLMDADPRLEVADSLLLIPDLFHHYLCGVTACEFTNATTTQCYDPNRKSWATELLARLGIPLRIFRDVIPPGTVLGPLLADMAKETGLASTQVVATATHDTGSAVAAVPFGDGAQAAYISSGTWSLVGLEVARPVISDATLQANITNEGGVAGTYRLLKNVMGLWLVQECRRSWSQKGQAYTYDELITLAEKAKPFTAFIDPDDERFLRPGDLPATLRTACRETGQPEATDPGQLVRVILESLALKYRLVLRQLEVVTGARVDVIHTVGGGAQNRLLCQMTADATGRPLLAGPVEATAIGNLIVQAIALGELGSVADGRELIRNSLPVDEYEPGSDWAEPAARFDALLADWVHA